MRRRRRGIKWKMESQILMAILWAALLISSIIWVVQCERMQSILSDVGSGFFIVLGKGRKSIRCWSGKTAFGRSTKVSTIVLPPPQ